MTDPLSLINWVLKDLPVPLVGSVCYDGQKQTKECTAKAFAAFTECYSLVRPRRVLEIGTHAGGSALMALALTEASVLSVDIGSTWITPERSFADWGCESGEGGLYQVERVLRAAFPDRFSLLIGDSTDPSTRATIKVCHTLEPFDLAFIDGNHAYEYVLSDIRFARSLGVKTLILDDMNSSDPNSDVARAAREEGLVIVKEWATIHSGGVSFALTRVP
jgi:cephalosporin hydroxylase